VGLGVDVGIDPDRDLRADLALAGQRVDAFEFPGGLDIDHPHAEIDGLRKLGRGLADAGEHDLRRNEPGAQRDVDLAAGIGVGVAAQGTQETRDGQRRIGFQRVVDRVRVAGEGLVDGAVSPGDRRGAVHVKRRALGGGDGHDGHAVAHECGALSVESDHQCLSGKSVRYQTKTHVC
jgi:hypothetical protein